MRKALLTSLLICLILSACSSAAPPSGGSGARSELAGGAPAGGSGGGGTQVQSGVLTAGDVDDNLNFAAFQRYLNTMLQSDSGQVLPAVSLADRVTIRVVDVDGRPVSHARVSVAGDSPAPLVESLAGADGVFYFFPAFDGAGTETRFTARVSPPGSDGPSLALPFDLNALGEARVLIAGLGEAISARPDALDLMFVMDTTGSMGDEMQYLTTEFRDMVAAIHSAFPDVSMRFGLVVYRDIGDEYVVRAFDFTDSVDTMQQQLERQAAGGGGDYPEAMEQALSAAIERSWRAGNTARLLFLVADAPPHDENLAAALDQAHLARRQGLRIYPLAASGVADTAEYLMRIMAVATHSRHLFLTDDSGVGNEHAEPKVPCYVVTRLDQLLIRVISAELSGQRVEPTPEQIIRSAGRIEGGACVDQ